MTGVFHETAQAAGWTEGDGTVHGPDGAQAWLVAGGGDLPDHKHLCLTGESDGHRFAFAIAIADAVAAHRRSDIATLALHGPIAVAAGAVMPWLDRLRDLAAVWVREAEGPWWPLGGGRGRGKVAGPSSDVQPQVTALLAALTRDPSVEAVDRAERTLAMLRGAGWRSATSRTAKAKPGYRCLASVTFRGPGGAKHLIEYHLMGDARLPEGLLWRYELPVTADASAESATLLIDVTGVMDLDIPLASSGDRLAIPLRVVAREALTMKADESAQALLALTTVTSALRVYSKFSTSRLVMSEQLSAAFPVLAAPPLDQAVAAVHAGPVDGPRWLALGFAALDDGMRHVAVGAFAKAAELGTGDGIPLLWHARLLRVVDPDTALAQLDHAAAAGGVTGLAREFQGDILRRFIGDRDRALAAYARSTEEAPEHVGGWLSRGLHLAKYGMPGEAVQVLTEAATLHATGMVSYYLGYAQLLVGDHDGALDSLETAVRRDPHLATEIMEDPDLTPLRGHERFDALPTLAAEEEPARHQRARDAARSTGPAATLPRNRANDLGVVADVLGIFRRKVNGYNQVHAEGVTHPATREFLETVGLPREVGEFRLDPYFDSIGGAALREYRLDDHFGRLHTGHVPSGLAGLFVLGKLDGGAEAALDGRTGEVFRVAEDFSLSWLAADLEAFLLPRCLPDDTWVWRLTTDTIHLLAGPDVARIGAGRLALVVEDLGHSGHERLNAFLREHGELLNCLRVTGRLAVEADLTGIDFTACCPNLSELRLRRGAVNESVFFHPALEKLNLREAEYKGSTRDLRLDAGSRLSELSLEDCLVHADSLYVGPASPLYRFRAAIDEDYGFVFPGRLEFDNCPELYSIDLNLDAGAWTLILRGSLPRLQTVRQDARPYGSFTSTVVAATPADKKAYQSMIRKGARYARRG